MHSLLFIGGGNMARSLIGGVIAGGQQPAQITVCEPNEAARQALATDFGVTVANERDSARCAAAAEVIVLAVIAIITSRMPTWGCLPPQEPMRIRVLAP